MHKTGSEEEELSGSRDYLLVKPLVAIVGRPNVGKSSLFNALLGRRQSIVSEVPGTTRDRLMNEVSHLGKTLLLADTGGLVPEPESEIEAHITAQVDAVVDDADAVIFVTDARDGITYADEAVANRLRRSQKPTVLVVNKVDNVRQEMLALESYKLFLGDPIPASAQHRTGLDDILDTVVSMCPGIPDSSAPVEDSTESIAQFAIVGRPNVGKSALTNTILGRPRSIVSDTAGTTRDTLDALMRFREQDAVLLDTAGIRRRGSIKPGIERYSVLRAARAIDQCTVAIILLDATQPATDQDLHIAGQVMQSFKGAVIAVNKWDLIPETNIRDERMYRRRVLARLKFMPSTPVVFISAIERTGIDELLQTTFQVHNERLQWVPQARLNRVVMGAIARHLPPTQTSGSLKIYRVKQESVGPPTFVFYCNNPSKVHFSYERYIANAIRKEFGFIGTQLRLEFRGKGQIHIIGQNRAKAIFKKTSSRPASRKKS